MKTKRYLRTTNIIIIIFLCCILSSSLVQAQTKNALRPTVNTIQVPFEKKGLYTDEISSNTDQLVSFQTNYATLPQSSFSQNLWSYVDKLIFPSNTEILDIDISGNTIVVGMG